MNKKYSFTKSEVKAVLDKYGTIADAAKALGCSFGTMYRAAQKHGIDTSKRVVLTKKDLKPYVKGYSWAQIGVILGCSASTIRNAFEEFGIKKEDRRNRHKTFWL